MQDPCVFTYFFPLLSSYTAWSLLEVTFSSAPAHEILSTKKISGARVCEKLLLSVLPVLSEIIAIGVIVLGAANIDNCPVEPMIPK